MPYYCTFWDYDANVPFDEIQSRVNTLIARGAKQIFFYSLERGNSLLISDREFSEEEAGERWGAWLDSLPDDDAYTWYEEDEPEPD